MTTTKITITNYLAEYMAGKYGNHSIKELIQLPDSIDLYQTLYDLMQRRPINASQFDNGNLWLCLPQRRHPGKDPQYFNYLSLESAKIIDDKIYTMFWADLHDYLDKKKHEEGIFFEDAAYEFLAMYSIESITVDGLKKNHKRWRDKIRYRKNIRKYSKKTC